MPSKCLVECNWSSFSQSSEEGRSHFLMLEKKQSKEKYTTEPGVRVFEIPLFLGRIGDDICCGRLLFNGIDSTEVEGDHWLWDDMSLLLASIILPRESILRDYGGTFLEVGPYSWVLCYWACRAGPLLKWGSIAIGLIQSPQFGIPHFENGK